MKKDDPVHHPSHYTSHPSGVECIDIVEHMSFNVGAAVKYLWRAGLKNPNVIEDLCKSRWFINREIERMTKLEETSLQKGARKPPAVQERRVHSVPKGLRERNLSERSTTPNSTSNKKGQRKPGRSKG